MRNRLAVCLLSLAAPILSGCGGGGPQPAAPTGEKIELKLNMSEGDDKSLSMQVDMDIDVSGGGQSMNMEMAIGMDMGFKVLEVADDGNHTLEVGIERMKMDMSGIGQAMHVDTDSPGDDPVTQAMMPIIGLTFTQVMSPYGETLEIRGLEDAPLEFRQQLEQSQNGMQMMATYPRVPVDNGDTWSSSMTQEQNGQKMTIDATYTLLDRVDGAARVGIDGKVSGFLTGKVSGELQLDLETGWLRSGTMRMDASARQDGNDMEMAVDYVFDGK